MFSRKELKDRCKAVMQRSYWRMFLVSFIAMLLCGRMSDSIANQTHHVSDYKDGITLGVGSLTYTFHDATIFDTIWLNNFLGFAFLIVFIIGIIGILYGIFIANPLRCGVNRFFLQNIQEAQSISVIFSIFSDNYLNVVKIMLLKNIKIFLWTLLFVIPGIIKSYEYQMIPYLLAEDPSLSSEEAFARSRHMTMHHKFDMFVLDLSFIGWRILGSLLIIGNWFVNSYYEGVLAELYLDLQLRNGYDRTHDFY